jgi:hypothetical protein
MRDSEFLRHPFLGLPPPGIRILSAQIDQAPEAMWAQK